MAGPSPLVSRSPHADIVGRTLARLVSEAIEGVSLPDRMGGTRAILVCLVCAVMPTGQASAVEFERLEVTEDAGTYHIAAALIFNAPPRAVIEALLDFEDQKTITPPIKEARIIGTAPDGGTLVQIVTDICIGPFCKDVKQVQVVHLVLPATITAQVVTDGGDLKSGYTVIEVYEDNGRARVQLDSTIQPRRRRPFFIPDRWVLNAIRRQARQSAAGLEALALRIAS